MAKLEIGADQKVQIITETAVRKFFSFKINEVNLEFTLRIDIPTQMEDFLRLIEIAKVEVSKELDNTRNHE